LSAAPFDGRRLFFLETEGVAAIQAEPRPKAALLVVGPPGGWDEREAASASRAGFVAASLGPRVLRTETAAITALVLAQGLWGDLA
jgi:16S rRNA (uracil1498-N3)-methyltransferase